MDMYRILESFDAVNSKQTLVEGAVKRELHAMADKMTKAEFVAKVKADDLGMSPADAAEFWNNCNGKDDKELDESDMEEGNKFAHNVLKAKAAGMKKADLDGDGNMETVREDDDEMNEAKSKDKDKDKEKKSPFPGSPEYEKKHGKFRHDDDSAFHKTKVSTGTVYSRKHKEEPEVDDEEDKKPKKSGRPAGTKKKIGAKGPSVHSKLLKGKGGLKEHDDEMNIHNDQDSGEYDDEAGMARQDLHTVVDAAKELHDILASDENLPEWVQAKITKALDYIDTSRDYIKSSHADQDEQRPVAEASPPGGFKQGDKVKVQGQKGTTGSTTGVFIQQLPTQAGRPTFYAFRFDDTKYPGNTYDTVSGNDIFPAGVSERLATPGEKKEKKEPTLSWPKNTEKSGIKFQSSSNNRSMSDDDRPLSSAASITRQRNYMEEPTEEGATPDQLDQQKMSQMKRAAATRTNSRGVQQQPPTGGPRRSDIPAGIRRARGDAPLGRDEVTELSPATLKSYQDKAAASAGEQAVTPAGSGKFGQRLGGLMRAGDRLSKQPEPEVKENGMGGTVAGGIAPAAGQKTFAEASSGSHEVTWKAAGKAVHAIMKQRGYAGSKTEQGYMWTRQTPRGTAFVDIDFDERDPDTARWGEGELKGAKNKSYYQSGNDNVSDLAQVIGELFANIKLGQPAVDEADDDGKKDKPSFGKKDGKHKPDDDGDGVPDWADKKPGSDDNEELDDSEESDDDKELKLMKSRAGVEDKDEEDDKAEKAGKKVTKDVEYDDKDDDESDEEKDDKAEKDGKKVTKDIEYDDEKDEEEKDSDEDDSEDEKESKDESADNPKKSSGMKVGTGVYESAFNKSLKSQLRESINMNTSQDSDGKKSVTVTATDEDADKLGDLLKMAGLFSSEGYSSVCQDCGGIHEADACGADHVEEAYGDFDITTERDLANSPDEEYTDADYMTKTLSGGLNGIKRDQTTNPIVKLDRIAGKIEEAAKTRLWNLYKQYDKK